MSDELLTLTIPTVPGPQLSANSRAHWRRKDEETLRLYGIVRAEAARRGYETVTEPVAIAIAIVWPLSKKGKLLDQDNAQSSGVKAIVDALRPCACLRCRTGRPCRCGGCRKRGQCERCHAYFWKGLLPEDSPQWVKEVRATVEKGAEGPCTRIRVLRAVA